MGHAPLPVRVEGLLELDDTRVAIKLKLKRPLAVFKLIIAHGVNSVLALLLVKEREQEDSLIPVAVLRIWTFNRVDLMASTYMNLF